ncbi:MAG: WecB/TagA/CpsF family glycosyltransferase [Candidatus Eremiobacteraeota bacterium]|nr:WecB/TagA/CpsF family glycosyltransferase [Candidatus Eremiobacteraeota bacterium]
MELQSMDILGVKVHRVSLEETLAAIGGFIEERSSHLVVTLGTEMVMAAQKNKEFLEVLNAAHLVCADAVGIIWASKRMEKPLSEKVAGIEILDRLAALSYEKGWRLFFLGAAEGTAEAAVEELRKKYPEMPVAGIHHGFFKDDGPVIRLIKEAKPDILFIALGSPRQELWFWRHREELGVPVGIGVGGSFDVLSGKISRSPRWMISLGLEWLYRLYKEPWRWKRMTVLPVFALKILFCSKAPGDENVKGFS